MNSAAYQVTTIAGNSTSGFRDGKALEAMFDRPYGICCSNDGKIYVTDYSNHRVRMISHDQVTTIAGNGQYGFKDGNALEAMFGYPWGICISNHGKIYVSDYGIHRIRLIYDNKVILIAGNGQNGFKDGNALEAMFSHPRGLCCSNDGKIIVSDSENQMVRMIDNNQVTRIAGNGQKGFKDGNAIEAMFHCPSAVCYSNNGRIYVAEYDNNRIRMIYNNQVTTIAGNGQKSFKDGNALEAMFYSPMAICCSKDGKIYVADYSNYRVRMIYKDQVTTIAGSGQNGFKDGNALEANFRYPMAICCPKGGKIYVVDDNTIRLIYNNQDPTRSHFGFALLEKEKRALLSDCQISFHGVDYHLHSTLVNVRCPFLLDQSRFSLIEKSNISNKSFDSFVDFLYSNNLTNQHDDQTLPITSIQGIVELIYIFDIFRNCNWILIELKTEFESLLAKMLSKNDPEESVKNLMVQLLPTMYNFKELIGERDSKLLIKAAITCSEACYNILISELQKKRSIVPKYVSSLQPNISIEAFMTVVAQLISDTVHETELLLFDSMIVFGAELTKLSRLAFKKTNICQVENSKSSSSTLVSTKHLELEFISREHLDEWTRPDFVIKLFDDDIEYHVHKLILCGRWNYFYQMIESGLKEVKEGQMTLSDDWNRSRFEKFMKYLYLNENEFDTLEDAVWLMKNRKLYGITVYHNSHEYLDSEQSEETAAYGFEELYEHCIGLIGQPLTLSNCISLYLAFEEIGEQSLIQRAFNFISQNFLTLLKDPKACKEIQNIPNHDQILNLLFGYLKLNQSEQ